MTFANILTAITAAVSNYQFVIMYAVVLFVLRFLVKLWR